MCALTARVAPTLSQEMMAMLQKPDALKDLFSNPELLQQSMKQAQALFGGAGGGANLAELMGGMGGAGGLGGLEGLMGGGGGGGGDDDDDLKARVRAQMAGMMRDREDEEEF